MYTILGIKILTTGKTTSGTLVMHLSSASPRGDPGLMWGNMGTLWGLCNKFLPFWWGKCGDFDFWIPYSREECWDFASVKLRGDKERSIVRSIHGKMVEEKKKTVKNLYVFVGISNFKIPLCIYYFLKRSLLDIGVRAPSDLGPVTFLPEKNTQYPNGWWLKSGCKRRRSPFSQLMKRLSLENLAQLKVCILNSINSWKKMFFLPWRCPKLSVYAAPWCFEVKSSTAGVCWTNFPLSMMLWEWRPKRTPPSRTLVQFHKGCFHAIRRWLLPLSLLIFRHVFSWIDWTDVGLPEVAPCRNYIVTSN